MVRKFVTAQQKTINVSLQIPAQDVGKKFEVIAYTVEEQKALPKKFSSIQLKTEGFKFNRIALHER